MKEDLGLLILRIGAGLPMIAAHGWPKLMRWSELSGQFPDPIGVGHALSLAFVIFAEVFCCVALIIGLGTRFMTIPPIITMIVAVLVIHGNDPFAKQEKGLLFLIMYVVIAFLGAGKFSIDHFMLKNKKG